MSYLHFEVKYSFACIKLHQSKSKYAILFKIVEKKECFYLLSEVITFTVSETPKRASSLFILFDLIYIKKSEFKNESEQRTVIVLNRETFLDNCLVFFFFKLIILLINLKKEIFFFNTYNYV